MAFFRRAPPARPDKGRSLLGEPRCPVPVRAETAASSRLTADEGCVLDRRQVQDMVAAEMKNFEENLAKELQSVLGRLFKTSGQAPSVEVADDTRVTLPRHRHDCRRRWTCTGDGSDSLSNMLLCAAPTDDSEELPQEEDAQARSSTERTPASDYEERKRKFISFDELPSLEDGTEDAEEAAPQNSEGEEHTDVEETSLKSGSSVVWRIDALDCGDRLAASAAAKKGSASVDSIVELVESERERWAEEKVTLEARLEELKEQRQMFRRSPDAEKAELKRQVQELRETMKQRSRFGAWVCERHMQESDDEETSPGNLEKEELRATMATLEAELREARAQAATGAGAC